MLKIYYYTFLFLGIVGFLSYILGIIYLFTNMAIFTESHYFLIMGICSSISLGAAFICKCRLFLKEHIEEEETHV